MFSKYLFLFLFALLLSTTCHAKAAWDTLWINADDPNPEFTANQALLYDTLGRFTIGEVSKPAFRNRFKFVEVYGRDDGLVDEIDVYWSRIVIINQHWRSDYVLRMAEILDTVTLYVPNKKGGFDTYTTGRNFPLSQRIIKKAQGFALPLYLPQKDTAITIYIRCVKTTNYYSSIGGIAGIIDSMESMFSEWTRIRFLMGLFLGMLFIAVLIAIVYYWVIHFRKFPLYVWDAIFTFLFAFDNMELYVEWGLPTFPGLSWVLRICMFFFRVLFALQFISAKQSYPDIYKLLYIILGIATLLGFYNLVSLNIYTESIALFAYASLMAVIHILAFWQLGQKEYRQQAIYFLVANIVVDISVFFVLFESNFNTISTQNIYYFSLAGETVRIIILVIGIAQLVRKKEKEMEAEKQANELKLVLERMERENEKKHLARELHDNMGMQLTRLLFEIEKGKKTIETQAHFQKMDTFTRAAIHELREAIWVTGKENISLKDLVQRIDRLLDKTVEGHADLDYQINISPDLEQVILSPLESLNLYRIFQEGIQNILKHSQADFFSFSVKKQSDAKISLSLSDNGIGVADINATNGNGFSNMTIRAKEIDAIMEIGNNHPKGLIISVLLKK